LFWHKLIGGSWCLFWCAIQNKHGPDGWNTYGTLIISLIVWYFFKFCLLPTNYYKGSKLFITILSTYIYSINWKVYVVIHTDIVKSRHCFTWDGWDLFAVFSAKIKHHMQRTKSAPIMVSHCGLSKYKCPGVVSQPIMHDFGDWKSI